MKNEDRYIEPIINLLQRTHTQQAHQTLPE